MKSIFLAAVSMLLLCSPADAQHRGFGGFYRHSLPFASTVRVYGYPSYVGVGSYANSYSGSFDYGTSYGQDYTYVPPVIQRQIIYVLPPPVTLQAPAPTVIVPPVPAVEAIPVPRAAPAPCPSQGAAYESQGATYGASSQDSYGAAIGANTGFYGLQQQLLLNQTYAYQRVRRVAVPYLNRFFGSNIVRNRLGGFGNPGFVGAPFRTLGPIGRTLGAFGARINFGGRGVVIATRRR